MKFIQPFAKYSFLKFIGLDEIFNPDHVNAFYYNPKLDPTSLTSKFKDRVIKFDYNDFTAHFDFKYVGMNACVAKSSQYDKTSFVQSISKSIFGDHLDMTNFHMS